MSLFDELAAAQAKLAERLAAVTSPSDLEEVRIAFAGRKGLLRDLAKGLGELSAADKPAAGRALNELKATVASELAAPAAPGSPRPAFDTPAEMFMNYFVRSLGIRSSGAARLTSELLQWYLGRAASEVDPEKIRKRWQTRAADPDRAPRQP